MTVQEIREHVSRKAAAVFDMKIHIHGMTDDMARDEANMYIAGAVDAFKTMGALTKREAVEMYSDLFLIR